MDLSKAFDDLTWDNVVIEDGVLKSIREFPINELKHKDLCSVQPPEAQGSQEHNEGIDDREDC